MNASLHVAATPAQAALECAEALCLLIGEAIAARGRAMIGVSGGSTPKLMFDAMTPMQIDWSRVHLFFVDERAVPPDHDLSNYRMTRRHLLDTVPVPASSVHRVKGELPPGDAAAEYAAEIAATFGIAPGELPVFDALQCGIGADSHTASLFPGEPLIGDREKVAEAVYVEKMEQHRITLMPAVLTAARRRLVLATGSDKVNALRQVLKEPWKPFDHPAQLLVSTGLSTDFYIDEAAALEVK